ncbi:amidohydrolase family protein [Jeotgalicoccus sp. WY2]|uniref:amidohydrolase family protein n=1 Tax=Jeotgalicoccus sp. WY2 TaxID=2708346 RepID=UPI00202158C0|nr:amidohydrolase family protein [Jeotgalicoccus sp. WY2]
MRLVTANTAEALKLKNKGVIAEGLDADYILSKDTFEIEHVIAKGQHMIENKVVIVKGTFE